MSLIKSISGIRGTIGGLPGEGLTPIDLVSFVSAFALMIKEMSGYEGNKKCKVVVGRDARTTGPLIESLVSSTLCMMGLDVIELGLATTPTVEMGVVNYKAQGGIILTASHNPGNWNALKLLNSRGEFFSAEDGVVLLNKVAAGRFDYSDIDHLGKIERKDFLEGHIKAILALPLVKKDLIEKANFTIVVDAINSVGGFAIPSMLQALGVRNIVCINCNPDGLFAHNPEPLPDNLTEISAKVKEIGADLGIVVDPDVDRLALVSEDGQMFGEEYTLVAVADYVLSHTPGSTVSNLSSSRALRDITVGHGCAYTSSAVGEVNVVEAMKRENAVIGGEGNGGIIYPELHFGRDSMVGVALFLSHLASKKIKMSELKGLYPVYFMSKKKIVLNDLAQADIILKQVAAKYEDRVPDLRDGVKIDLPKGWIHLRKSNTEPILRIYTESETKTASEELAKEVIDEISELIQS